MDDYLEADCVINTLFNKGILVKKNWKLEKGTTAYYAVTFEFKDAAKIAGFNIYIKGTYHCIGKTALINQSARFNIPMDDILVQCIIPV